MYFRDDMTDRCLLYLSEYRLHDLFSSLHFLMFFVQAITVLLRFVWKLPNAHDMVD